MTIDEEKLQQCAEHWQKIYNLIQEICLPVPSKEESEWVKEFEKLWDVIPDYFSVSEKRFWKKEEIKSFFLDQLKKLKEELLILYEKNYSGAKQAIISDVEINNIFKEWGVK